MSKRQEWNRVFDAATKAGAVLLTMCAVVALGLCAVVALGLVIYGQNIAESLWGVVAVGLAFFWIGFIGRVCTKTGRKNA